MEQLEIALGLRLFSALVVVMCCLCLAAVLGRIGEGEQ